MFPLDLTPASVGLFADALLCHKFPSHRSQHVIVVIEGLEAMIGELALHCERDQKFLAHQPKAVLLHGAGIRHVLHAHRLLLTDSPNCDGLPASACKLSSQTRRRGYSESGASLSYVEYGGRGWAGGRTPPL